MSSKKVRLLVDHQAFSLQNYGGITAYYEWLLPRLKKYGIYYNLSLFISSNYQISKIKNHLFLNISDSIVRQYVKYVYFLLNSFYTFLQMKFTDYDIFHATYHEPYFLRFLSDKKLVVTIYDCANEGIGSMEKWTKRIIENRKKLINRADCVIAISNEVKKDIIKYYNVDSNKIKVIYLFGPLGSNKLVGIKKVSESDRFVLYIGTRGFNKNFELFVKAYQKFNIMYPDIKLVCLGGGKFTDKELTLFEKLNITQKISWKYIITDKDAVDYLQAASMFVYPSLNEGFGVPIVNAFVCGCPVVASDLEVFKETFDGAFVSFKSKSIRSLVNAMDKVLKNPKIIYENKLKGYQYVNKYTIERMVKETANVYKSLS